MKNKFFKRVVSVLLAAMTAVTLAIPAFADALSSTVETSLTPVTIITSSQDVKLVKSFYSGGQVRDAQGFTVDLTTATKTGVGWTITDTGFILAVEDAEGKKMNCTPVLDKTYGVYVLIVHDSNIEVSYCTNAMATLNNNEKKKATQEMAQTVASWGLSSDAITKFSQGLEDLPDIPYTKADSVAALFNQGANIEGAMAVFAPFGGVVGMILGIGVIIIMVLLLTSTVLDLVYLGIPTLRNMMTLKHEEKGGAGHPFGISSDAWRIVQEQQQGNNGGGSGSVYLKYFKSRILTYIILGVCILYLVSGQIGNLVGGLLDLVGGMG